MSSSSASSSGRRASTNKRGSLSSPVSSSPPSSSTSSTSSSSSKQKRHRKQQQRIDLLTQDFERRSQRHRRKGGGAVLREEEMMMASMEDEDFDERVCSRPCCIALLAVLLFAFIFVGLTIILFKVTSPSSTTRSSNRDITSYRKLETPKPVIHPPVVLWWFAPVFSGGGYCSEAISIILGLNGRLESFTHMSESEKSNPSGLPWSDSFVPYPTLLRDGIKLQIFHHGDSFSNEFVYGLDQRTARILHKLSNDHHTSTRNIAVCHSEPGAWNPALYPTSLCPPDIGIHNAILYKIGRTMFETDRIPSGWIERCNGMDEIWVPSHFHIETFRKSGVAQSKLFVIPEPVDLDLFNPHQSKPLTDQQLNSIISERWNPRTEATSTTGEEKEFRFLSVFKWEKRKGWNFLLEAFLQEFSGDEAVTLYILTAPFHSAPEDVHKEVTQTKERIQRLVSGHSLPQVLLLRNGIPTKALPSLYKSVHSLVIPSRGEGWGRPHMEAMAMGLPVIATNWSGNLEFMNRDNSFLIEVEQLEEINEGWLKGHRWAKPSVASLRSHMRYIYENYDKALLKGKQARRDVVQNYSPIAVADKILERLDAIARNIPDSKDDAVDTTKEDEEE
eukprot:TRINITY_DN7136_c0_g1_i1.p1 TRINITY_DN7136_c0_g1~~TRINITY_DN7136_c0_g1_i1.p1  ORF type:complete len:616 (+),score=149.02 TRINITY_DN7136_c0_g1_i1:36-1883(+)